MALSSRETWLAVRRRLSSQCSFLLEILVEFPNNLICVTYAKRTSISRLLDLGSPVGPSQSLISRTALNHISLQFLDLVISHGQAQLLNARLDSIPALIC
jgi:hypothetical protein